MVNKISNIKERVIKIAEHQEMTKGKFFKSIGMTSASFRGKAKDTPLNSNAVAEIIRNYPEVDVYWLLMGETRPENLMEEAPIQYGGPMSGDDKDALISALYERIEELKSDKEDLRKLLGLSEEKK